VIFWVRFYEAAYSDIGHRIGISSEPDIEYWKVMNDDFFIVLASDGIWDVMNTAEVVGYIIRE
jgi:serine/threonine protein phosphatase PrpC